MENCREPALRTLATELQATFAEYAAAVAGQREATRQRSLEQYFKVNVDAGNAMGRLQALRQQLVGELGPAWPADHARIRSPPGPWSQCAVVQPRPAGADLGWQPLCWGFIAQRVLHPLREAGQHFQRIAGGDLSVPVQAQGSNEIGQLFHEQRMQQSQRDTLGQIGRCARQLDEAATRWTR